MGVNYVITKGTSNPIYYTSSINDHYWRFNTVAWIDSTSDISDYPWCRNIVE